MTDFFQNVLTASFHGSIVILAVMILRLVLPVPLQSRFSLQPQSITLPVSDIGSYDVEDSATAQANSPWGIFFRVDDDLLCPSGGEVWIATNAVGVSNYTTDGAYWLEKKVGKHWERLGGETKEASWGQETVKIRSQTEVQTVDWTADYGKLDPGVYRMGKRFYSGADSIIQYAEFAVYQTGGIYGEGAEKAVARVDAAIEKLQSGNYRVEKLESSDSPYGSGFDTKEVIWKYGDTVVEDFYRANGYSHSAAEYPGDILYGNWLKRSWDNADYDCIYFPEGYGVISDREIRFAQSYSQNTSDNPCTWYTYRFDENGNLTEILTESCSSLWNGYITRYVITDTPEGEIKAWVEQKQAEQ